MFADINHNAGSIAGKEEESFLIIDKSGKIISVGEDIRRDFSGAENIFEIISDGSKKKLSDPIISGNLSDNVISLERIDSGKIMTVNLGKIIMEGRELFKMDILSVNNPEGRNTLKIDLYSGEVENYLPKSIKKIIEVIKSNYPFTLIGKSKTQRILNEYDGFFWVKDADGKLELVNNVFAEFLGVPPKKLEGKKESDVLPNYLSKIFRESHDYIIRTKNNVLLEDLSGSLFLKQIKLKRIAQIPLVDIDYNIVAVLAFTVERIESEHLKLDGRLSTNLDVSDWMIPVLLIEENGKVLSFSHSAGELFNQKLGHGEADFIELLDKNCKGNVRRFLESEKETNITFLCEVEGRKYKILLQKVIQSDKGAISLVYIDNLKKSEIISSEIMYDTVIHSYPLPALIYNAENLKFLEVNNDALKLYGYTREEFLGMDLTDLYAPEDIQSLIEAPEGKKKNGNGLVMRQKRKDGSFIIVEINNREIEFNGTRALFSSIKDISEEIELEKKLQLYKASFENSDDPIVITDKHGFVKFVNDAFIEIFGYTKAEIEQNPISTILVDTDRGMLNSKLFQSEYAEEKKFELRVKTSDDREISVKVVGTPIFGFGDVVERFSLIFKVDAHNKIESRQVNNDLNQKGIDSTFLSNLFHELLTPLNVIIGFVQELSDSIDNPNEEQREAIQIIEENQKVLLQTMDIAVEYSHLEQDYVDLSVSEIRFVDLLDDLHDSTKKTAESNEVELNYGKISSSLQFVSDKHKFITFMRQMIHFSLIMTHESEIYISGNFYGKDKFVIGIKDRKSGISEEMLSNLKAVFTEDEMNIRKNYGLSRFTVRLVRKLLEILKGEIHAVPSTAHPNEFGIVFPLELKMPEASIEHEMLENVISRSQEAETPLQPEPVKEPIPEPERHTEKEIDLSELSCLYVEDQIDSQILFKVQMKELKSMEFANSFEKALPLLKSKKFDFIVMDINLQGEYNGLDALKIIKKMPGYEDIPILAVTAYVVPGAAEKFIQAGFSGFVNKPLLREKVVEALKKIL